MSRGRPRKYNSLIERAVGEAKRKLDNAEEDLLDARKEYEEMMDIKTRLEESYAAKRLPTPPDEDDMFDEDE